MDIINTIIGIPLGYIMWACFALVGNYGFAIILFTLITKLIMFPLSVWVQKNSIRMIKIKPMLNEVAVKFAGDRDKVAEKQLELYKRENYKPMAGVIPMLIQIPIILGLIAVIYNPLQHLLHMDATVISALAEQTSAILGTDLGASPQLKVIETLNDPQLAQYFANMQIPGADAAAVISQIQALDLNFFGLNLSHVPTLDVMDAYLLVPVVSGGSSLLLSVCQNRVNVLQKESGALGRWGMAAFLTAFSLYFTFIVPAGVGLYWIFGNLFSIAVLYIVNAMYDPKKYIDYEALEKSKAELAQVKELEKKLKPTPEQKKLAKESYKKFCDMDNVKKLMFYSEKNGFYKYYKDVIEYILAHSDIVIHYVTSDPNDDVFSRTDGRIVPYYVDDNRLIPLMMKVDADMVVMTMPDLGQYHIKRSLVRKDVEYVYMFHYPLSTHMVLRKGALDFYDTIFMVGDFQEAEIRKSEALYGTPEKKLIPVGYGVLEDMSAAYEQMDKAEHGRKKILIAPSWQPDNILDSCIGELLDELLGKGFQVVVRPHPEYVKRFGPKMDALVMQYDKYDGGDLTFELDFTKSDSIWNSDVVISDWSGTAYEFAFVTKKPAVFINTPMKVNNPEYEKLGIVPKEIELRDRIGIQLMPEALAGAARAIESLLERQEEYAEKISAILDETIANFGRSGEAGGQYIIDRLR